MKKLIVILLLNFACMLMVAQSNIRLNNYWANLHYINPSAVYDKYMAVFSIAASKQWYGFSGAPTTFFGSATTYIDDIHSQIGLVLVQDKIGFTSTTSIDLSYAYSVQFQNKWQLHLGLGLNNLSTYYDPAQVNLITDADNNAYQYLKSENNFNADLGMEVLYKSLKVGISSQNVFSMFSHVDFHQTNTNFLYVRYRDNTDNVVNMGYGICGIQYSNMYQMEVNATSYLKIPPIAGLNMKPELIDVGLFYRTGSEIGLVFGFELGESLHLSYTYNYHVGGISRSSLGTNELMLTYNLSKRNVCHSCWY